MQYLIAIDIEMIYIVVFVSTNSSYLNKAPSYASVSSTFPVMSTNKILFFEKQ